MQTVIVVIHLMVVTGMIGVVLLQKSEGGGLGVGGGGGFMSTRGTANVLTRATAFLAAAFFGTSLLLSILAGFHRYPTTILQPPAGGPTVPGAPAPPLLPGVPPAGGGQPTAPSAPPPGGAPPQ
jgi:preprotein translocase subunit SecG